MNEAIFYGLQHSPRPSSRFNRHLTEKCCFGWYFSPAFQSSHYRMLPNNKRMSCRHDLPITSCSPFSVSIACAEMLAVILFWHLISNTVPILKPQRHWGSSWRIALSCPSTLYSLQIASHSSLIDLLLSLVKIFRLTAYLPQASWMIFLEVFNPTIRAVEIFNTQ